ncbi:hypothetical protein [Microbacterium oxydans]|uniref:hypothetical protein n=1 Tax=Microbacterium oxydans TaxID=82380 RepID=UPI00226B5B99|nr:hypothetical protein [Microbacterium oxydans]WAA64762.1 hypothetical protein MME74_10940 [Microbacterium oxydans]
MLVVAAMLTACSPTPTPTPTPTPLFASEAEAFAAAEATYSAYNDALNQVDFSETTTFEAVFALLSGTAASSTREAFSRLHAEKTRVVGQTHYYSFSGATVDWIAGLVHANVCVDVSDVDVLDASGASIVSADRPPHQPMTITFSKNSVATPLTISDLEGTGEYECAG